MGYRVVVRDVGPEAAGPGRALPVAIHQRRPEVPGWFACMTASSFSRVRTYIPSLFLAARRPIPARAQGKVMNRLQDE
jgi:hypothetical protein